MIAGLPPKPLVGNLRVSACPDIAGDLLKIGGEYATAMRQLDAVIGELAGVIDELDTVTEPASQGHSFGISGYPASVPTVHSVIAEIQRLTATVESIKNRLVAA